MRIAILGTRGIPNNYGGFEQNAENLSVHFQQAGHDVTVYCPVEHPYRQPTWSGIRLQRIWAFEHRFGVLGTALFDFLCLLHTIWSRYDVILELGYGPSGLFFPVRVFTRAGLVTNMDGLEWKRSKWGPFARRIWLLAERMAVRWSDALVADNPSIQDYLHTKFGVESNYIGYGAAVRESPAPEPGPHRAGVEPYQYHLVVARLEPENNLEMILDGYAACGCAEPILVIGKCETKYGKYLRLRYADRKEIRFLGAVYEYEYLASLRYYAQRYFHGHSVGGTNPALLEAMASGAYISAHDNPFNRYVLGSCGTYFGAVEDVTRLVSAKVDPGERDRVRECGWNRLRAEFNWEQVSAAYLTTFDRIARRSATRAGLDAGK